MALWMHETTLRSHTTNVYLAGLTQIIRAMVYLHAGGVLHCDIKPENVRAYTYTVVAASSLVLGTVV